MKTNNKPNFTKEELAGFIQTKYPNAELRLLREEEKAFFFVVLNVAPLIVTPSEFVILIYWRDKRLPFHNSFDWYTQNKYFKVPL